MIFYLAWSVKGKMWKATTSMNVGAIWKGWIKTIFNDEDIELEGEWLSAQFMGVCNTDFHKD